MEQFNIFDYTRSELHIDKPIRLIELFCGYGSQAMALENLNADFEHYLAIDFDKYAMGSYNAVHGTEFPVVDICDVSGSDLKIVDTDKYCYIVTYSFPCTDLSIAGKMKGMEEGSGTRSSLLWEVKRLLSELTELPQILLMENVTQVHSQENTPHFRKWLDFLEEKGYVNYCEDLNAKDYGVAQNRDRCFLVSILGEYNYKFPRPIPLTKTMKDYLEDEVDEKYYINSQKALDLLQKLIDNGTLPNDNFGTNERTNERTAISGLSTQTEHSKECMSSKKWTPDLSLNNPEDRDISNAIMSRQDRGISQTRQIGNGVVEQKIQIAGSLNPEKNVQDRVNVYSPNGINPTIRATDYKDPIKIVNRADKGT